MGQRIPRSLHYQTRPLKPSGTIWIVCPPRGPMNGIKSMSRQFEALLSHILMFHITLYDWRFLARDSHLTGIASKRLKKGLYSNYIVHESVGTPSILWGRIFLPPKKEKGCAINTRISGTTRQTRYWRSLHFSAGPPIQAFRADTEENTDLRR